MSLQQIVGAMADKRVQCMTHDAMACMWVDIHQLHDARACLYGAMKLMHCSCVYYKSNMHQVFGDLIVAKWTKVY